jgi:uncharacterized protein YjbI with pentapeptide repeats
MAGGSDHLHIEDADLVAEDFSGRKLRGFSAVASRFERCRFERMRIDHASLGAGRLMSHYVDCSFDGSRIRAPAPGSARFERCSFRDVRLKEWICWTAEFVDRVFTGRAEKCIFNGRLPEEDEADLKRSHNEFRSNDFSGMELRDVAFRSGIDLSRQVLPGGDAYVYAEDGQAAIVRARADVSGWDGDAARELALRRLRLFERQLAQGQQQLFVRKDDFIDRGSASAMHELFALLTDTSRPRVP